MTKSLPRYAFRITTALHEYLYDTIGIELGCTEFRVSDIMTDPVSGRCQFRITTELGTLTLTLE